MVHYITQYYETGDSDRQSEINECLLRNLQNPEIAKVHLLLENKEDAKNLPAQSHFSNNKLVTANIGQRLTFKGAFEYANTKIKSGAVCFANADVYLASSLKIITETGFTDAHALCVSRHEMIDSEEQLDDDFKVLMSAQTQDAWILRLPMKPVSNCDFRFGELGCDNAIAYRFREAGYIPVNIGSKLKFHHLHAERKPFSAEGQTHPNEQGGLLLPDFFQLHEMGISEVVKQYEFEWLDLYAGMCATFTQRFHVDNRRMLAEQEQDAQDPAS